ncbi:MAG TPA: hypothetical protein VFJ69_07165 [Actinomycetota bacterium]|nr:hypothetical protein [Actinomycetota bacterium]
MAATAFPALADMPAQQFVSILATADTALGAALLAIPVVPLLCVAAGIALPLATWPSTGASTTG